jgi:Tol biopolymer transport system component
MPPRQSFSFVVAAALVTVGTAGADVTTARSTGRSGPRVVATGGWQAPRFSPDGTELLVSGERFAGLSLLSIETGRVTRLVDDEGAGIDARFTGDGRVAFRARRAGERRDLIVGRDLVVRIAPSADPIAWARGDRIWLRTADGVVPAGTGDRFFAPIVSPDGSRVAFQGLTTGIHVVDVATGQVTHVGRGTAPAWSADGSWLIFERTEDDGHTIVASDLWTWRPGRGAAQLTDTDDLVERRPSISPDGLTIAFDDDAGSIHLLPLGEVTP